MKRMKKYYLIGMVLTCLLFACNSKSPNGDKSDNNGWQLVWSDEFDTAGKPDPSKWSYDVGGHGWGNNELQYYTAGDNVKIENGRLIIEAKKESVGENNFTSARLITKEKGDWKFGRFEISAKLPWARGTWPAIWMLPTVWDYGDGGWPDNGEIDIMEHVGFDPGVVHATIHTSANNWMKNNQIGASKLVVDAMSKFNTYALEWSADSIQAFVNDQRYFVVTNDHRGWESWPFDKPFHLLLNLAVGGNWGGVQGVDEAKFPQKLEVDYVRVYQKMN